jgi:hypothetical protein
LPDVAIALQTSFSDGNRGCLADKEPTGQHDMETLWRLARQQMIRLRMCANVMAKTHKALMAALRDRR